MSETDERARKAARLIDVGDETFVLVRLSDFRAMAESLKQAKIASSSQNLLMYSQRSSVVRDPEIAHFVITKLGLEPVQEIAKKCRRRFGKSRAPSVAAIYRYWRRMRTVNTPSKPLQRGKPADR